MRWIAWWTAVAALGCGPAASDGGGAAEPQAGASEAPAGRSGPRGPGRQTRPPGPDRDGDGVVDAADSCPDEPEDLDGFRDVDGCPDPDNDRDRVPDVEDGCPSDPETPNGVQDEDGCPEGEAAETGSAWRFVEPIEFDGGTDDLTAEGEAALRRTAERLESHPEWLVVEIESHSDSRGASQHNLDLTRHRAGLIRERLIALGIAGERLIATGYGEMCPRDGRPGSERNRRVEIVVLETTDGCTGEPIGCPAAAEQLTLSSRLREYLPGSARCGGAAPAAP